MRAIQFICDGCGTELHIKKLISYFTCKICGSYLLVEKIDRKVYTEVIDESIYKSVDQNKLNQLLQERRAVSRMTERVVEDTPVTRDSDILKTLLLFMIFGLLAIHSLISHEMLSGIFATFCGVYTHWYVLEISGTG